LGAAQRIRRARNAANEDAVKVAHRLYLTVVPALLGVLAVAALAYWGQYARAVPHLLVVVAAVTAVGTLVLAMINARYVAQRVERLAGGDSTAAGGVSLRGVASAVAPGHIATQTDELDTIERVVDRLSHAVAEAESDRAAGARAVEERARDYARMLSIVADNAAKRLEDVRLPLHILLENRFGDLNENQEEMLGAARAAAEATDADLVALRQIAELDLGTRTLRRDRIKPTDMIRALLPTLQATAEKAGVILHTDLDPLVPAIRGDQPQLQDSLATILGDALAASASGTTVDLKLETRDGNACITLAGAGEARPNIRTALAGRVIAASGGSVQRVDGVLTATLPGSGSVTR